MNASSSRSHCIFQLHVESFAVSRYVWATVLLFLRRMHAPQSLQKPFLVDLCAPCNDVYKPSIYAAGHPSCSAVGSVWWTWLAVSAFRARKPLAQPLKKASQSINPCLYCATSLKHLRLHLVVLLMLTWWRRTLTVLRIQAQRHCRLRTSGIRSLHRCLNIL